MLTGGGAMMKHIQQLAEFSTGLEVRIGHPNEHLTQGTPKEMASPMYSTGIGLVIETLARMEHDEQLRAAQEAKKAKARIFEPVPSTVEEPIDDTEPDTDDKEHGFGKKIIKKAWPNSTVTFKGYGEGYNTVHHEVKITIRFWIVTILLAAFTLITFKIR